MDHEMGKICAEGLSFFGKTNRLISHELKNILAIISETLGLLDELVALSGRGTELKPEKLVSMSKSMLEEVERANGVIRSMNTFAHRVDAFAAETDLEEVLSLMFKIAALDSISKKVDIHFERVDCPPIFTCPFFLQNLFHLAISYCLSAAGPDGKILVLLQPGDREINVVFSGLRPDTLRSFPTKQMKMLSRAIGARIDVDDLAGQFRVVLPEKMTGGPLLDSFSGPNP